MNMREIQVVCEIANHHSFSEAAYSLSYSPSVISKYVSSVEEELGIKIFIRGNKSSELALTAEGQVLIQELQRINAGYQHMLELTKQLKGTYDNVLRLGSQSRLGNLVERDIISAFLLENSNADMEQVKMSSKDLVKLFQAGKLDAFFISAPEQTKIEDYFHDLHHMNIEVTFLTSEREIYLGISDKYLPGIEKEAPFAAFKDFSFAFAFPMSTDENDSKAIDSFQKLAEQSGFKLKTAYFGAHDTSILKLATKMPIAVATTNIPAQFEGIKFIRVSDWNSYTNVYFVCLKNNRKRMLLNLKKTIADYLKQTATEVQTAGVEQTAGRERIAPKEFASK